MSVIKSLSLGMSADAAGFKADIERSIAALDAFSASVSRAQGAASDLDLSGAGGAGGGGGGGGGNTADFTATAQIGQQLQTSIGSAATSVSALIGKIVTQFDQLGGTVTRLAQRIDAAMKMPAIDRFFGRIQTFLKTGIKAPALEKTATDFSKLAQSSALAANSLTRFRVVIPTVAQLGEQFRKQLALEWAAISFNKYRADVIMGLNLIAGGAGNAVAALRGFLRAKNWLSALGDVAKKSLSQIARHTFTVPISGVMRLGSALGGANSMARKTSLSIRSIGREITMALGFIGGAFALVSFFKHAITGAAELQRSVRVVKSTFGDASKVITDSADEMTAKYGTVNAEFVDAATKIGSMGRAAGMANEPAAKLGATMAKLAADLSARRGIPFVEAVQSISAGIKGVGRELPQFGVIINDNTIKARAYALGLAKVGAELTESQKVQARASIIMRGMADTVGELDRTFDDTLNSQQSVANMTTNLATQVGQVLLPAYDAAILVTKTLLAATSRGFAASKEIVSGWVAKVTYSFNLVKAHMKNLPLVWDIAVKETALGILKLVAWIETVPTNLGILADYVRNNWKELMVDAWKAVSIGFQNMIFNLKGYWQQFKDFITGGKADFTPKKLLEGYKATAAELPEFVGVKQTDQMKALAVEIANSRSQLSKAVTEEMAKSAVTVDVAAQNIRPDEIAKKRGERQDNAAVERGTKEAYSAISKAREAQRGKFEDKQLAGTKKQLEETKKTNSILEKITSSGGAQSPALAAFPI